MDTAHLDPADTVVEFEPTTDSTATAAGDPAVESDVILSELLVEEISIDGMCGVY